MAEIQQVTVIVINAYKQFLLPYGGKHWRIDSFQAFGEGKFGELIDQPIDY